MYPTICLRRSYLPAEKQALFLCKTVLDVAIHFATQRVDVVSHVAEGVVVPSIETIGPAYERMGKRLQKTAKLLVSIYIVT